MGGREGGVDTPMHTMLYHEIEIPNMPQTQLNLFYRMMLERQNQLMCILGLLEITLIIVKKQPLIVTVIWMTCDTEGVS